jgi:hypothetical protein
MFGADNMKSCCYMLCISGLLITAVVRADEPPKLTYADLLEKVKNDDPKADFQKLRMAFTETPNYKPYDLEREGQQALKAALENKDHERVLELANKMLGKNYVDARAHLLAFRACKELKKEEEARHHRYVYDGLVQSIRKSGDGKTMATAYVVISTDEEYVLLQELGLRSTGQALMAEKDQKFDRIDAVDEKKNERVILYFNVSKPFAWLSEQLGKDK